uniref:Uncharacterized protein n=1 Tax=Lactuca sativa TaxID=4236 RepID=A0A9R1UCP2_LACSA|nr:hypothetical protein LSAT_V11C900491770 [Lactuca sativa]
MSIIQTELLEMVKIMEMHRQNQIRREEETEAEIANMKKNYYSEEETEAEKFPPVMLPPKQPTLLSSLPSLGYESRKENEMKNLGGKVAESESKPKKTPQLQPPMLSQPPPCPLPSPPHSPSPPPPPPPEFEENNGEKMESSDWSFGKQDDDTPPSQPPPPPLLGIQPTGKGTMDSMRDQVGKNQYEQRSTLLQITEDQRRFSKKTAPLVDRQKEEILGFCKNGLKRDKWAAINTLGSQNAEHTMDLMGNVFNLSPNLIVSAMILTTKVKQRLDPRYFHVTLSTRQLSLILQSHTFVFLLHIELQSATSYPTTKPTALMLEALASPNLAFKTLVSRDNTITVCHLV